MRATRAKGRFSVATALAISALIVQCASATAIHCQNITHNTTDFYFDCNFTLPNMTLYYNSSQVDNITDAIPHFNSSAYWNTSESYNSTQTDGMLSSLEPYYNTTEADGKFSNISMTKEQFSQWNGTLWQELEREKAKLLDRFDEMMAGREQRYAEKYATKEELANKTEETKRIAYRPPSALDIYSPYIFYLLVAVIALFVIPYNMKVLPNISAKGIRMPRLGKHAVDEETGETTVAKFDDILRDFRHRVSTLAKEQKITYEQATDFMDRLTKEHVTEEKDFESMAETYISMKEAMDRERGGRTGGTSRRRDAK